ncbi:hypothetical protein F8388_006311 [Cannabis sativa]|uniref:TF-B3 domain-containing protein n=1 Tax=Cannabis sativa TaxID=3483 RepID=A0A7J6EDN0_CANSA|nr:hypothetical protein F8388_006311 [Cannabis sativa]
MDQHNSLFGTLVKDITSLVIPIPLSTTIEALPILQRKFLGNRRVYIQGSEWNSFVRDRGIRVGDVLLLKLVHQVSQLINMIINVTLIRLNRQNNHTFTPPLPQQNQEQEQDRNWEQPFLCVKRLSDIDVCKVVEHVPQILMPKEIWEVITESSLVVDFHLNDMLQVEIHEDEMEKNKVEVEQEILAHEKRARAKSKWLEDFVMLERR